MVDEELFISKEAVKLRHVGLNAEIFFFRMETERVS